MEQERRDYLAELFEQEGIKATTEQINFITDEMYAGFEMEGEMQSHRHFGITTSECEKCKRLEKELEDANDKIDSWQSGVEKMTGSDNAIIENGQILIERRY